MNALFDLIATVKCGFDTQDLQLLQRQCEHAKNYRPYKKLKILHNVPFNAETILKLEPLYLGGADVCVTSPSFMQADTALVKAFQHAGGRWLPLAEASKECFDIHLDCAAELLDAPSPSIGCVELTGSGTNNYKNAALNYPVISVDQSRVKYLEAVLGTGEAFVRAFTQLSGETLQNKHFLLFGYGKVGRGIAKQLREYHAKVTVVERNDTNLEQANKADFAAYHFEDRDKIHSLANQAFAIVTATGFKNAISDSYERKFFTAKYLANMGGEDEFGYAFDDASVMCNKSPINFHIKNPTLMRYLDPVFYAHNLGVDLLLYSKLKPGLHAFPSFIAEEIVAAWTRTFNEALPS